MTLSRAVLVIVAIAVLVACGGTERRADRLWRQALERVERNDTDGAIALMQKIIDDYPDAPIAQKAREQIVVYRGLAAAVKSYPGRRARELMVQIARAVEASKRETGKPPGALQDLVPARIASIPADPWGQPFVYQVEGQGYRLRCNGSDGAAGGEGDAADLVVVNGEFVAAP